MTPVVAVIAPGMMGAAVGKRLVDNGLKVLTSLKGRSRGDGGAGESRGHGRGQRRGDRGERFHPVDPAAGRRGGACRALSAGAQGQQRQAGLCRLQRHQSEDGRPRRRGDRADRLSVRRFRHHRLAAEAGRCRAAVLRLRSGGAALCHASPIRARRPRAGWRDERRFGAENVLCRHHQGHAGDRGGDDAGGDAGRLRRRAVRGAQLEPEGDVRLVQARPGADAAQGLSLGRRDARDRRLRRRRPDRARALRRRRAFLRAHRRGFRRRQERRGCAHGVSGQKSFRLPSEDGAQAAATG